MPDDLLVGNGRVLTFSVFRPDGSIPSPGDITAVRMKIINPAGVESNGVLTPVGATVHQWTGVVKWTTPGKWIVRFESDGLDSARERSWRIQRSATASPD